MRSSGIDTLTLRAAGVLDIRDYAARNDVRVTRLVLGTDRIGTHGLCYHR